MIFLTGGSGNLGKALLRNSGSRKVLSPTRSSFDIKTGDLSKYRGISVLIHAAALTRPMSGHEIFPDTSIRANIMATARLANQCYLSKIKIVYISTDYVYSGTTGNYKETDPLSPVNAYGWSKLGGECSVRMISDHLILRCALAETPFPHVSAFYDVYKSYISMDEASKKIWKLIDLDAKGIFNIGGPRKSIYDYALAENKNVTRASVKSYTGPSNVAKDCSMDISKYDQFVSKI